MPKFLIVDDSVMMGDLFASFTQLLGSSKRMKFSRSTMLLPRLRR